MRFGDGALMITQDGYVSVCPVVGENLVMNRVIRVGTLV